MESLQDFGTRSEGVLGKHCMSYLQCLELGGLWRGLKRGEVAPNQNVGTIVNKLIALASRNRYLNSKAGRVEYGNE